MALLVFMTFLSMFTNSYIPVWMQDNERAHMSQAINQFGDSRRGRDTGFRFPDRRIADVLAPGDG
jgi:hypothetical protein